MSEALYFLITVGFPITGLTIVLVYYIINRYKERKLLIEKGKDVPKNSPVFPFSETTIIRAAIICIGVSFGMFAGLILMEISSNPILFDDEGVAWGITIPLFTGISLLLSNIICKKK